MESQTLNSKPNSQRNKSRTPILQLLNENNKEFDESKNNSKSQSQDPSLQKDESKVQNTSKDNLDNSFPKKFKFRDYSNQNSVKSKAQEKNSIIKDKNKITKLSTKLKSQSLNNFQDEKEINENLEAKESNKAETKDEKIKKYNSDFPISEKRHIDNTDTRDKNKEESASNDRSKAKNVKVLPKIILSAKSSNKLEKPTPSQNNEDKQKSRITDGKDDKIKKVNSEIQSKKDNPDKNVKSETNPNSKAKGLEGNAKLTKRISLSSISPSKIQKKDQSEKNQSATQNLKAEDVQGNEVPKSKSYSKLKEDEKARNPTNQRKIAFAIQSTNLPKQSDEDDLKQTGKIKHSNSDFPSPKNFKFSEAYKTTKKQGKEEDESKASALKKEPQTETSAKNTRKSISSAKSSNIIRKPKDIEDEIEPSKQKVAAAVEITEKVEPKEEKIKKSNSGFPSAKRQKIDDSEKVFKKQKEEEKNENAKLGKRVSLSSLLPPKIPKQSQDDEKKKESRIKRSSSEFQTSKPHKKEEENENEEQEDDEKGKSQRKFAFAVQSTNLPKQKDTDEDEIKQNNKIKNFKFSQKSAKKEEIKTAASKKDFQTKSEAVKESQIDNKTAAPKKDLQTKSEAIKESQIDNKTAAPKKDLQTKSEAIKESQVEIKVVVPKKDLQAKNDSDKVVRKKIVSAKSSNLLKKSARLEEDEEEAPKVSNSDKKAEKIKRSSSELLTAKTTKIEDKDKVKKEAKKQEEKSAAPIPKIPEKEVKKQEDKTQASVPKTQEIKIKTNTNEIEIEIEIKDQTVKQQENSIKPKASESVADTKATQRNAVMNDAPKQNEAGKVSQTSDKFNSPNQQQNNRKRKNPRNKQNNNIHDQGGNNQQQQLPVVTKPKNAQKHQNESNDNQNNNAHKPASNNITIQSQKQNQKPKLNIVLKSKESLTPRDVSINKNQTPNNTSSNSQQINTINNPNNSSKNQQINPANIANNSNKNQQINPANIANNSNKNQQINPANIANNSNKNQQTSSVSTTNNSNKNQSKEPEIVSPLKDAVSSSADQLTTPLKDVDDSVILSEEMKKQNYEKEREEAQHTIDQINEIKSKQKNQFMIKMCLDSQPVCIAVGDIEGDLEKLYQISRIIKANPTLHFVFIGDIIDDLSDACPLSAKSWECLSLLSEYFVNNMAFTMDSNASNDQVHLPSAFCDISFGQVKYGNIRDRVKFLAGNAECDNLLDFQKPCESVIPKSDTNKETLYVFGQGKWKKTVTYEKMCLLYRYLKSCYGIIKLKKSSQEAKKNNALDFTDTVYFRHSPSTFKVNRFPKNMYFPNPDLKKADVEKGNFIFVTGHARIFATISSAKHNDKELVYVVDTTVLDAQNQYLKDVGGFGTNDRRLAVISFDNHVGFTVKAISLPCQFPKSTLKCKISDKYVQIKGI
ncbi:hypothetical protein M9Y10_039638 [Tritrichomonas musculus]|uniref:Calcineurin-like phosphoesterase domain-containing protein n=1 Tax=Tritrichomonas musculus TaxID=1915356 RepID=A0ABR2GQV5_9EUKA